MFPVPCCGTWVTRKLICDRSGIIQTYCLLCATILAEANAPRMTAHILRALARTRLGRSLLIFHARYIIVRPATVCVRPCACATKLHQTLHPNRAHILDTITHSKLLLREARTNTPETVFV